jgi:hypothetical protein
MPAMAIAISRERGPHRRPEGDAKAEQQLDRREDRVQRHEVVLQEARVPGDRPGDDGRIARRGRGQHLGECLGVHERLELEHAVEQPHGGKAELKRPWQVRRRHGGLRLAALPAPQRGAADDDIAHRLSPGARPARRTTLSTIEGHLLPAQESRRKVCRHQQYLELAAKPADHSTRQMFG